MRHLGYSDAACGRLEESYAASQASAYASDAPDVLCDQVTDVDIALLASPAASSGKNGSAAENGFSDDDEDEVDEDEDEDDEEDDAEFKVPTSIKTGSRKRAAPGANGSSAKKPRASAGGKKTGGGGGARKKKAAAEDGDEDFEAPAAKAAGGGAAGKDFKIEDDNGLFSAWTNSLVNQLSWLRELMISSFRLCSQMQSRTRTRRSRPSSRTGSSRTRRTRVLRWPSSSTLSCGCV